MQTKPETFAYQAFSGFFIVCWAILALMVGLALLIIIGGVDVGVGDGYSLLGSAAIIVAVILLSVWLHPEQRERRGLPRFKYFWQDA